MEYALRFRNVTKIYPGISPITALRDVTVDLEAGCFAALVGPSGSGKTTFLNLAAGLDEPSSGTIAIGDRELTGLSLRERGAFRSFHVGFVFQSYNLLKNLTARENVELISIVRGDDPEKVRRRADRALEQVGLADKGASFPAELSGGQQQRVAIARALVTEPRIVFADEPTANLDYQTAHQLIELFERLNREEKTAFLFSTHDPRMIDRVSRKIMISDGAVAGG